MLNQQAEALRDALESILMSVETSSAEFSWQREALEGKRRRVLRLLVELTTTTAPPPPSSASAPPALVSPSLEADKASEETTEANNADGAVKPSEVEDADGGEGVAYVAEQHRLLGNVFLRTPSDAARALGRQQDGRLQRSSGRSSCDTVNPPTSPSPVPHHAHDAGFATLPVPRTQQKSSKAAHSTESFTSDRVTEHSDDESSFFHYEPATVARRGVSNAEPSTRVALCAPVPPSLWINVWPCFGETAARTTTPTRLLVRRCYRFFADVVERAAAATGCQPAAHALYTPDGCAVRELDDLVAEGHYLLFPSGGFYRRHAVPTALLWLLYDDARLAVHSS